MIQNKLTLSRAPRSLDDDECLVDVEEPGFKGFNCGRAFGE